MSVIEWQMNEYFIVLNDSSIYLEKLNINHAHTSDNIKSDNSNEPRCINMYVMLAQSLQSIIIPIWRLYD